MDRPVRRASSKAESDMPADYTCVAARVVLCIERRGLDHQRKSAAGIAWPFSIALKGGWSSRIHP